MRRLFQELKRRRVFRVGGTYLVAAFVVVQLADLAAGAFDLPGWFEPTVWVFCGLGLPIALVLAWAFDLTPEGVERTPPAGEGEDDEPDGEAVAEGTPPRSASGWSPTRLAGAGLLVLGILAAAAAGSWFLVAGGDAGSDLSRRTVAVFPFQVSGQGTETWREGMVSVLSTGLDGAGGLRAIADQTVLAAWRESPPRQDEDDAPRYLEAARRLGARYAVTGSAVKLGDELRFSARLHRVASGERMGQVRVRGSPDQVTTLADSLTRRVLGVLLAESGEELPSVDLGRVTTRSLPALKAYLEGERLFRAGDLEAAFRAYESAIREDSTFALAYTRLLHAGGWERIGGGQEALERAFELSDRLPRRERRLIRAAYTFWERPFEAVAAADSLRRLSRDYPDDPAVWYNLAEVLWHGSVPGGWPEADRALDRAVELDAGVAPYHHHRVDLAFTVHHDSALAAERIAAHPGRGSPKRLFRTAHDLVFGDPETRTRALESLDTATVEEHWALVRPLRHPADGAVEDTVLEILADRDVPGPLRGLAFSNDLHRGHIRAALADLEGSDISPTRVACGLAGAIAVGMPIPDSVAGVHLDPARARAEAPILEMACRGTYLVDRGRADELDGLISRVRSRHAQVSDQGGMVGRVVDHLIDELEGYRAWRRGDPEVALQRLSGLSPLEGPAGTGAVWRGDLHADLGRHERALRWYMGAWQHPLAHQRLGRTYEEMGRPERAAEAYRRFIAGWQSADESLQPRVERVRERLEALPGESEP